MRGPTASTSHRILARAAAIACVATLTAATVAAAAELDVAELDGVANTVTVEQGATASFQISLSATGGLRCTATPSSPATAALDTAWVIDDAGSITSSAPSTPAPFYADAHCNVTWPGDPAKQIIHASVHADINAPLGTRVVRLRPTITNPAGSGDRLADASATFLTFEVVEGQDTTPPTVVCDAPTGIRGAGDWYISDVAVGCTASDDGSGLADPSDAAFTLRTSGEGTVGIDARTVADVAGNTARVGPFGPFDVDLGDPVVGITSPPPDATYTLGESVPVAYDCFDAVSGIAACERGAAAATGVGLHEITVEATDHAGRTTTVTRTYRVVYAFSGLAIGSTPKAGSAIPLRWSLGGAHAADAFVGATSAACDGGDVTAMASPGDARPSADGGEYRVVWKTDKAWSGTCRTLRIALDDGTVHTVEVTFR